ncbi:FG-GAP repeat domain-containing protein [Streptomyces sp. NPDC001889]
MALSVGAGLLTTAPQARAQLPAQPQPQARAAGETVLPAATRTTPRELRVSGLGQTGFASKPEGSAHYRWTEYATGRSWDLSWLRNHQPRPGASDTFHEYRLGTYHFSGPDGGGRGSVTVPRELRTLKVAGTTVIAAGMDGTRTGSLHLLKPGPGGSTLQRQISGFPGSPSPVTVAVRDARTALITHRVLDGETGPGAHQATLVDLESGRMTPFLEPVQGRDSRRYLLSDQYIGWRAESGEIRLQRRDDPNAPEIALTADSLAGTSGHILVGDHVVAREAGELGALVALPLDGGPRRQLLEKSHGSTLGGGPGGAADGSGVHAGGTGADDWAVHRVTQEADGTLAVTRLAGLPPIEAAVTGLAFSRSTLSWTDRTAPSAGQVRFHSRTVPAGKNPQAGPVRQGALHQPSCAAGIACEELYGAGDGSVVHQQRERLFRQDAQGRVTEATASGLAWSTVRSVSGSHTLTSRGDGRHFLLDWREPTTAREYRARAAALWEGRLWTAEKPGKLSLTRLGSADPAVTVNTGTACVPDELQAVGRWVYWHCDAENKAGVLDRARGGSVPVSDSPALLGDGVLVHQGHGSAALWRTALTSGKAVTGRLAQVAPDEGGSIGDRRQLRWTLDPHTNRVAHVGPGEAIHLVEAAPAAAPAFRDHAGGDGVADLLTLNSSGAFTFQQGTGAGGYAGKVSGGGWKARTVAVPFGDVNGDGCNDVLVRRPDGELRAHRPGCGKALTPASPSTSLGQGWSAYNVLTSPGDLTGDRRPDLLARKASDSTLHLFAAKSDGTLAAGRKIGSGWTYTHITGAGDLNGDGAGDVVARARDGVLYRFDGTGKGTLKNRVKLFTGWGNAYNTIVGAGDITGDGRPDLVSRDSAGDLYRNSGDGRGSFGPRTRIAGGWKGYTGIF